MQNLTIKLGTDHLNWEDVNQLFVQAPLGARPPDVFKKACELSGVVVSIFRKDVLVGFGRALTDFSAYATIYDVVVLPEHQGQGIGKIIINSILEQIPQCWAITLFAEPGKETFYEKFGFMKMKTSMGKFKNETGAKEKGFV